MRPVFNRLLELSLYEGSTELTMPDNLRFQWINWNTESSAARGSSFR